MTPFIRFTLSRLLFCAPALGLLVCAPALAADNIHHHLQVRLLPNAGILEAEDTLTLAPDTTRLPFTLHAGLSPEVTGGKARLAPLGRNGKLERFVLLPDAEERSVTLSYRGRIHHAMEEIAESPGRSHQRSRGIIGPEGVFLDSASGWYPLVAESLQSFELEVELPAGWLAVSQGAGPEIQERNQTVTVRWREQRPQDDIYLIAAPFRLYQSTSPEVQAQVYLRQPDPALAQRYLEATERYLQLYSRLLGDYPYAKFALVENFWATGYGMPSFTLLGSQVIRLPFIIHTSYPHEILHNWWGNGVYVDYATGNWSEGLTTYLADHLLREQRGKGPAYRRDALQRYADYVREGKDFPLREFRGRHSSASQSVGYGKGFMLFHMLRRELGDRPFIEGLRRFYREHRFRVAGYADLQRTFEQTTGRTLSGFFTQWLQRTGAPTLAVADVETERTTDGYRVMGLLRQAQPEAPFQLLVPLAIHLEQGEPVELSIPLADHEGRFDIEVPSRPLRLDIDPRFDLFRTLYAEESPPTLSALFGSDRGLILLPAAAPAQMTEPYRALAQSWSRGYDGWEIRSDSEIERLPTDRPVWLLGWENRFLDRVTAGLSGGYLNKDGAEVENERFSRSEHSIVLTVPAASPKAPAIAWLGAHGPQAVPGLARKLPHYGKYGWLVFNGQAPDNLRKEQWPVHSSPLSVALAEKTAVTPLAPATALTDVLD